MVFFMEEKPRKELGWFGKTLLMTAALAKGIGGIVKEDSQKSRAAFWLYAGVGGIIGIAVLALGLLPLPNVLGFGLAVGSAVGFVGAIKTLAALGVSEWAQHKNEKFLRDVFNSKAMMKRYDAYILPNEKKPGSFYVHKRSLLADTFNKVSDDVHHVSPGPLRRAAAFTKDYAVVPVINFISGIYNRVAGKTPEPEKKNDQEPPSPPPPQP